MIKSLLLVTVLLARSILAEESTGRAGEVEKKDPAQCWYEERYHPIDCNETQTDEDCVFDPLKVPYFCIPGKTGKPGEAGPVGNTGFDGAQGPEGYPGPRGDVGPIGPQGPIGEPGIQGPHGIPGIDGSQGIQGPMGNKGLTGAQGQPGDMGPQGIPGLAGPEGETQIIEIFDYAYMYRELMTIQEGKIPNDTQIDLNVDGPYNATSFKRETTYAWTLLESGTFHISFVIGTQGPTNVAIAINETYTPQTTFMIGAGQLQIQGFTILSLPAYTRISLMHVEDTNDMEMMTDNSDKFHKSVTAALLIERYGTYMP